MRTTTTLVLIILLLGIAGAVILSQTGQGTGTISVMIKGDGITQPVYNTVVWFNVTYNNDVSLEDFVTGNYPFIVIDDKGQPVEYSIESEKYINITITERSGSTLTNYPIKIVLDQNNFPYWNITQNDGSDIYVTDNNKNPLYYWIEEWDTNNKKGIIWVKIPLLSASGSYNVRIYFGGINKYPTYNNPKNVFLFYDDFDSNTLDTNIWTIESITGGGTYSITNGILTMKAPATGDQVYIKSNSTFSIGKAIRMKVKMNSPTWAGLSNQASSTSNCLYSHYAITSTGTLYWYFRTGSGGSNSASTIAIGSSVDQTNFHTIEIKWTSGRGELYQDDILKSTRTAYIPTIDLSIAFGVWYYTNYGELDVDWVLVRPVVTQEPTYTINGIVTGQNANMKKIGILIDALYPNEEKRYYIIYGQNLGNYTLYKKTFSNNQVLIDGINVTVSVSGVKTGGTTTKYYAYYLSNTYVQDYYYVPIMINLTQQGFTDWDGISHNDFGDVQAFYYQKEPTGVWTGNRMRYVYSSVIQLSVEQNKYYLVNTTLDMVAYYYDGSKWVRIPTYRWDLDPNYIIFQSPITGTVELRTENVDGTLSTTDWFYFDTIKPYITINSTQFYNNIVYSGFYNYTETKTVTYSESTGEVTITYTVTYTPTETVHEFKQASGRSSAGATYYATLYTVNFPASWSASITGQKATIEGDGGYYYTNDWLNGRWSTIDQTYVARYVYSVTNYSNNSTTATITFGTTETYFSIPRSWSVGNYWHLNVTFTTSTYTDTQSQTIARNGDTLTASNGNVLVFVDSLPGGTSIVRQHDNSTVIWVLLPYISGGGQSVIVLSYGYQLPPYPSYWGAINVFPLVAFNPIVYNYTLLSGSGSLTKNSTFGNPITSIEIDGSGGETLYGLDKPFYVSTEYLGITFDYYALGSGTIVTAVIDSYGNIVYKYTLPVTDTNRWVTATVFLPVQPDKRYMIGLGASGTKIYYDNIYAFPYTKNIRITKIEGAYYSYPPITFSGGSVETTPIFGGININNGQTTETQKINISIKPPIINTEGVTSGEAWQKILLVALWLVLAIAFVRATGTLYDGAIISTAITLVGGIILQDYTIMGIAGLVFALSIVLKLMRG